MNPLAVIQDFKPGKPGLEKVLGQLEAAVMEAVWRQGRATVRDVHQTLAARREIAYTTVMTIMGRLAGKGLLKKKKVSNAYVYEATLSRCDFLAQVVGQVVDGLLADFAEPTLNHFVERIAKEDPECLRTLERLLESRRGMPVN